MVKDNILCKIFIFSLVVFTKLKYNNSPPFVTFKLLLFKYRHNVHVICPKILFPIIERKKTKAILFSYARRYISNMITGTDNFKLKEIAQPRVAPFPELLSLFFRSSS